MLLVDNGVPQHRQLYQILRGHIDKGMYAPGDLLPSENALCQTYAVTRPTVRQALHSLMTEGFIKKKKGKGSIVQPKKMGIGILSISGTTDSVPTGKLETRVVTPPTIGPWVMDFDFEPLPEEIQSGCIRMERLRLIDGQPVFLERTNLPNINLPRFCNRNFENQSLFSTLSTHYGLKVTGGEQKIRAFAAKGRICRLLGLEPGEPVLHLHKKYETNRPYYHFYSTLWGNTKEHYLHGPF